MDPKALSHLDPKQLEAYQRVMGTAAEIHGDSNASSAVPNELSATVPPADDMGTTPVQTPADDPFKVNPVDTNAVPAENTPSSSWAPPADLTTPSGAPDPSPSIFTNSASTPDPTTETSFDQSPPANASFFTNPDASATDTNLTPPPSTDFPASDPLSPVTPAPDTSTFASDNLAPVTPMPAMDTPLDTSDAIKPQPFATPLPSPAEVNQAAAPHEASALLKVIYIVAGAIFFAIYTIFWIKVFNLPFLF